MKKKQFIVVSPRKVDVSSVGFLNADHTVGDFAYFYGLISRDYKKTMRKKHQKMTQRMQILGGDVFFSIKKASGMCFLMYILFLVYCCQLVDYEYT